MTEPSFPIDTPVINPEQGPDWLHSKIVGDPHGVPAPAYPGDDGWCRQTELFWQARYAVASGKWPERYFIDLGIEPVPPPMFREHGVNRDNPGAACRLVDHTMDHPLDLHKVFMKRHDGLPVLKEKQQDRTPPQDGVDFLGARWLDAKTAENISAALHAAFQVKYFYGLDRPEHVYGASSAFYACPPHPSYVAGHAAIAGATVGTWISHVELTDFEQNEMATAGRHYAHYRTLAGVHWAQDNEAGFDLGLRFGGQLLSGFN